MEQEKRYWENKVFINKGTLRSFSEDYDKICSSDDMFVVASQLFPTGKKEIADATNEEAMVYEYILYYKVKFEDKRKLNKETGKVEIDLTEKEGRKLDEDFIPEEVVI